MQSCCPDQWRSSWADRHRGLSASKSVLVLTTTMEPAPSPFEPYFNTPYAPTVQEIDEIHAYMKIQQASTADIDLELAELYRRCRELEVTKRATMDAFNRHHNLTTAVRRVPSEILEAIFLSLPSSSPDLSLHPVVAATHVCQQWRQIALATPLLWTHIAISTPHKNSDTPNTAVRWMKHLRTSCNRALAFL